VAQAQLVVLALTAAFAILSLGGGAYEVLVLDPVWPAHPELIQPERGGVSRRRFWIPAHAAFEVALLAALWATWSVPDVRRWLFGALATHLSMRGWSFADFIPKALAFERADPRDVSLADARRWTRRSLARLPLDLATCLCLMCALLCVRPG
jgi:hypothetical protein